MNNARVTVIPATLRAGAATGMPTAARRRVAAYARVSTDSEEQLSSYEAQVDHYTQNIQTNTAWEFAGVYTDEGISATNTKKRDGFNRMIADALDGKIDLIITKSVSRFARNTVDSLTTVRQLKEKGVEVYFEKENIYTLDSKGELLITIMSSLAQEESRSISENVTWGKRKSFADGKVSIPYKRFLGYKKGADGSPQVVEEEAAVVRTIYQLFLEGKTPNAIARHLTASGISMPGGKATWSISTVASILRNEKYKGDALLQKRFTTDFLNKTLKENRGEVPQYYVANSHPAIVTPETFDLVQQEFERRKRGGQKSCHSPFSGKLICGECGGFFGSKVWHSNTKYRRSIWQCNQKYANGTRCTTPHVYEDEIKSAFLGIANALLENPEALIEECRELTATLTDCGTIDKRIAKQQASCEALLSQFNALVEENARMTADQDDYAKRYDALYKRYETAKTRLDATVHEKQQRGAQRLQLDAFLDEITRRDGLIDVFDDALWHALVEEAVIHADGMLTFRLRDGSERNWSKTGV